MSDRAIPSSFDDHCRALGRLCIAWAVLDRKLTDLASVLVGRGPEFAACLWTGAESMRPRCEAIKKLLVIFRPNIDPEWVEHATALINRISTDLGQRRNRYIHDEWFVRDDAVTRIQWGGRLEKLQSHKPAEFRYSRWNFESTAHVERLAVEVEEATDALSLAVIAITNGQLLGQPPEPFWR